MNSSSHHKHNVQPLRERLRAETAKAIAAAAEEVFAARGLREARMEEIASRAGVSVGTVYNHFEDRSALLADLVERRRKELAEKFDQALSGKAPFVDQLRAFADTAFRHFEAHRAFLAIMLESDSARVSEPSEAMLELRARVDALVQRGVQQGGLRRAGRELWPAMLFGLIRAVLVYELRYPGKLGLAERTSAVVDFFLHGAGA